MARSPFFCGDLLHHLDLEIAFGNQLLQPRVLSFELLQAANIVGLERPKPLPPGVDRLLADPVLTGPIGSRSASRRIVTTCSSVNLDLRIRSSDSEGQSLK